MTLVQMILQDSSFLTDANLQLFKDNADWFADGTFKIAPHLFYQVLTIHARKSGTVLPMLYVFLQQKSQAAYRRVLEAICQLKDNLQPTSVMCDFEKAFHNALEDVFGAQVVIVGCLFHLCLCIWRKIQQGNLVEAYRDDAEVRLKCKMLMALAFLPVDHIADAFENIQDQAPDCMMGLLEYFEDTWIGRIGRDRRRRNPLFSLSLWSVHDRVVQGLPRTNNSVEAWHRAFQGTVGYVHPTVYKLVESIQLEQSHTENIVTKINAGRTVIKVNAKYARVNTALTTLVYGFDGQNYPDYLRSISHNIELNV